MKLDGLRDLYSDMKTQDIKRYRFVFTFNNVSFDVFYFVDDKPHKLAFGVLAENFYFELDVKIGFEINAFLGEKFNELVRILGLKPNEKSHFKPSHFFEEFNRKVPKIANRANCPKPHEVARYRRNVEECDKIYFCGWFDDEKCGKHVQETNLEKTRLLLGYEAYLMCKEKNISSKWTDIKEKAIEFYMPDN